MTSGFPLSIGEPVGIDGLVPRRPEPAMDDLYDGFLRLRRREHSRLWFRVPVSAPPVQAATTPGTDRLVSEAVRATLSEMPTPVTPVTPASDRAPVPDRAPVAEVPQHEVEAPAALTEWKRVQAGAPVLLLSAGPVLSSSKPGPILGPGMSYRITSMTGSVVGMEVMHANGDTRTGYANAVDLRSMEPRIATGELDPDKGPTGRLRLTKLATTTFGLFGG